MEGERRLLLGFEGLFGFRNAPCPRTLSDSVSEVCGEGGSLLLLPLALALASACGEGWTRAMGAGRRE